MKTWKDSLAELVDFYVDDKFELAVGGKAKLIYSSRTLYRIEKKIRGIGSLIDNLSWDMSLKGEDLHGVGEVLTELSDELKLVYELLDDVDQSKSTNSSSSFNISKFKKYTALGEAFQENTAEVLRFEKEVREAASGSDFDTEEGHKLIVESMREASCARNDASASAAVHTLKGKSKRRKEAGLDVKLCASK